MNNKPTSDDPNVNEPQSEDFNSAQTESTEEGDNQFVEAISEEEGLESAESVFNTEADKAEDSTLDEEKEFGRLLFKLFYTKAKEVGIDSLFSTTTHYSYYYDSIHIKDSPVEIENGNLVRGDLNANTKGFSGEKRNKSVDNQEKNESIESVFDRREDVKTRSFMIALAALNGCNYRTVDQASKKLQSILEPQEKLGT
ncbi:MAG: hypothetical protein F6K54_33925 [Okeania sp. SIO3B5]|uniref:hypothetical protein n=1 Tax=Okeania sp. SIO3B5 TaxID=2607811 RepID=UPI0013FE6841|nr:hypothetical protein [Okeania sp. SIO3B5]NEO57631.1 hypothetical protein [Okeania sp. SIO3B5]